MMDFIRFMFVVCGSLAFVVSTFVFLMILFYAGMGLISAAYDRRKQ